MIRVPESLERYAARTSHGGLTGVSVACHAIADSHLVMHVGVGCKNKATHLLGHDWERHCLLRHGWTEISDAELVKGAASRIGPYVRSWRDRMGAGFVCVVSSTALDLTGDDIVAQVVLAAATSPAPVELVRTRNGADEYEGYAEVILKVAGAVDWSGPPDPRTVSILGYWFDRYEGDHSGILVQLDGMLKGIGLRLGPVLFSGRAYRDYLAAGRAQTVVALPYASPVLADLEPLCRRRGRSLTSADLPIGLRASTRWLEAVGSAAGVEPSMVSRYTSAREEKAMSSLRKMRGRWSALRVAVFAEAPLAAGLCGLLDELGLRPVLVGLRGSSMGGEGSLREVLDRNGTVLPEDCVVVEDTSLLSVRAACEDLLSRKGVDGFIGSATELNAVTAALGASGPGPASGDRGPFMLEMGFPCSEYHALQQMPFMGYGGAVSFAQRLVTPPRLMDGGGSVHPTSPGSAAR